MSKEEEERISVKMRDMRNIRRRRTNMTWNEGEDQY